MKIKGSDRHFKTGATRLPVNENVNGFNKAGVLRDLMLVAEACERLEYQGYPHLMSASAVWSLYEQAEKT